MDIRTKLVLALVAVALVSMLALRALMYTSADADLRDIRLAQLDGLAEAKVEGLQQILSGWRDRVSLIASRTQLRISLQEHNQSRDPRAPARMERILQDAVDAVEIVESLAIYDQEGILVAQGGPEPGAPLPGPFPVPGANPNTVAFRGISVTSGEELRADFLAGLSLDGEPLGFLHVRLDAHALLELTESRTGLGISGESLIVLRDGEGVARVLHAPGTDDYEILEVARPRSEADPLNLVLEGTDGQFGEGMVDEHGNLVWVAIRHLPETGWGFMVKIDADEGRESVVTFQEHLTDLALALAAFAIALGFYLGFRFARPILSLVRAADRIRAGEFDARATVGSQDEVGVLARTFNQMAEELEDRVGLLKEYQRFFDASMNMLCIAGTDGYFKRVNPAFTRILGWTEEELLSRSFLYFVHPDDLESTEQEIRKLADGIPTISFENRYQCADGTFKELLWASRPEPETGTIFAIARDVTASNARRKQAKEQIETLRSRLYEAEAKLRGRS